MQRITRITRISETGGITSRHRWVTVGWVIMPIMLAGCVSTYYARDLAGIPMGMSKAEFVRTFSHDRITGPVPRASATTPDGVLEVLAMPVRSSATAPEQEYWFLFRNGSLVQWGRPEDWQPVAARYQIQYNPPPAARTP